MFNFTNLPQTDRNLFADFVGMGVVPSIDQLELGVNRIIRLPIGQLSTIIPYVGTVDTQAALSWTLHTHISRIANALFANNKEIFVDVAARELYIRGIDAQTPEAFLKAIADGSIFRLELLTAGENTYVLTDKLTADQVDVITPIAAIAHFGFGKTFGRFGTLNVVTDKTDETVALTTDHIEGRNLYVFRNNEMVRVTLPEKATGIYINGRWGNGLWLVSLYIATEKQVQLVGFNPTTMSFVNISKLNNVKAVIA